MKKNPNATGIEAVGHTYRGIAMINRINKDNTGSPARFWVNCQGMVRFMRVAIKAANNRPIRSEVEISGNIWLKE